MSAGKPSLLCKLGIAGLSLLAAIAVYVLVRPYPPELLGSVSLNLAYPAGFTGLLGSAPSFFYTLAFGLFIGAIARNFWHCLAWILLVLLLELSQLQYFAAKITYWLQDLLSERAWHFIGPYWSRGTFDPLDMLAALAGGLIALFLVTRLPGGNRDA